jgi:RND family efflux transporter MFP subunit
VIFARASKSRSTNPSPARVLLACLGFFAAASASAAESESAPVVAAVKVVRGEIFREVAFDAELRPYQEVELHARVTGYLDSLKVDAGDAVKENQVIAILDVPELKIEIENALAGERRGKAEVARAQATFDEAHAAYTRITKTSEAQPNLIAQQDLDAAKARDRTAAAALDAATALANEASTEVKKLRTMADYTRIVAPFTGIVTKRYAHPGALIQAGTSSGTLPLVRLSQNDKLRVAFPVSVSYVSRIKVGDPVEIRIRSINRTVTGTIARFSRKVETATRTMEAEVDVENADLSLIPGIYATAAVKMDHRADAIIAPIEAVSRNESGTATVFAINKDRKIEERTVTVGVETPSKIEIVSGVQPDELLMIGSRTQTAPGQLVEAKLVEIPAQGTAKTAQAH